MTELLDLGALRVPGGYFVHRADAPHRTPFKPSDERAGGYRHSFTYAGGGSTSRSDLVELIESARRKVFVASYFIGDREVREALCRAASRLHGGVYVISAMTDKDLQRAINEIGDAERIDSQIERKRFEELTQHGIAVRAYEGCHAKFAVVDDRIALVSSANLTTAGLDRTGENGVVVDVPEVAERIARFFAALWHGSRWEMAMTGQPTVGERVAQSRPAVLPAPDLDQAGPIWTRHTEHHIAATIRRLVRSASRELLLATFSLDGMSGRRELLLADVQAAVERGVTVRMLLRGRNHVPTHFADAATFAELGVQLYPCTLNHAKGVIADGVRGALFSANFDARHGLDRDVELGMRLDDTPALAEAARYFEHAIAERDLDYVRRPTAAVLAERLYSYQVSAWPLGEQVTVLAGDADWARLVDTAEGPVVFSGAADEGLALYAGHRSWRLTATGSGPMRLVGVAERQRVAATERLVQWLTEKGPRGREAPPSRGVCAATFQWVRAVDT
ncbi:phospholipase D-like domain-containing protein [Micromonospora matsumotoense]|uniref:phospholipase D-like domain-containing protein n=1 Tax=Micromonospora matsumotoense TaxID=121616 RepID=UPI003D8E2974